MSRRWAVKGICHQCRQPVLVGLDGDLAAWSATVDPFPLGTLGEALAQLSGRQTYNLSRRGHHVELERRTARVIRSQPAGHPRRWGVADVLAEHVCQTPALPSIDTQLAQAQETVHVVCPY